MPCLGKVRSIGIMAARFMVVTVVVVLMCSANGCRSAEHPESANCSEHPPPWFSGAFRLDGLASAGFRNIAGLLVAWSLGDQELQVGDDLRDQVYTVTSEGILGPGAGLGRANHTLRGRKVAAFAVVPSSNDGDMEITLLRFPEDLVAMRDVLRQVAEEAGTTDLSDDSSTIIVYLVPISGGRDESLKLTLRVEQQPAVPAKATVQCLRVEAIGDQEWTRLVRGPGGKRSH